MITCVCCQCIDSESDCILYEFGRCSEVLNAHDLAGVVVRMVEFALSALSRVSACNSSFHVSVFNCCPALDAIIVTGSSVTVFVHIFHLSFVSSNSREFMLIHVW